MRFDLVDGAYLTESVTAHCQDCMNWYVEMIESSMGKSAKALYDRPGLRLIYQLGSSPCRGEITAQGRTFTVEGATLWESSLAEGCNAYTPPRGDCF